MITEGGLNAVLSMHLSCRIALAGAEGRDRPRGDEDSLPGNSGGLPLFVQIQFDEVTSDNLFQNGKPSSAIRLHARIRAGRDAATKLRMPRVPGDDIMVGFIETSYENVMEASVRLPAPGEEEAWHARFEQRTSATSDV